MGSRRTAQFYWCGSDATMIQSAMIQSAMIHLFVNALAASAGGGLTYVRNFVPALARRTDARATWLLPPSLGQEFSLQPNQEFITGCDSTSAGRFFQEQRRIPNLIHRSGANVLLSAGNFALRRSPVAQILLSRNALYTSPDFLRDLLARHEYRLWLDTKIKGAYAKASLGWADAVIAPSEAFAAELRRWGKGNISAIHHGFDVVGFAGSPTPLPDEIQKKLNFADGTLRLLFVSHYNYYRNFETLLRALPILRTRLAPRPVALILTCRLHPGHNPGSYDVRAAAELVRRLGIESEVIQLGSIPYRQLHQVYRSADVYVTPAYAETFAHPLVEAMSAGLPIVASDLPVHREIAGEAAVYFPAFSPEILADRVAALTQSAQIMQQMSQAGCFRSGQFNWDKHVGKILDLAATLVRP